MNRQSCIRRRSKLLALAPVYGVPAGLVVAFLALASVRGPAAPGAIENERPATSLASLVPAAGADPAGPAAAPAPRAVVAPAARPAVPARPASPVPAHKRAHVRPAPAVVPTPVTTEAEAAVALVGPTIEDLGEPVCDASLIGPLPMPGVEGASGCPMSVQMEMVNASAVRVEVRHEWAAAVRKACEHEIAARKARRASGAI